MLTKIKRFVNKKDLLLIIFVILISLLSFAIGFITARYSEREPIEFQYEKNTRTHSHNT